MAADGAVRKEQPLADHAVGQAFRDHRGDLRPGSEALRASGRHPVVIESTREVTSRPWLGTWAGWSDVLSGTKAGEDVVVEPAADFLAQILKDAPQPVWVIDTDGLIVFANPAAVAALGYDVPGDLYRRHSHDTVHRLPDGSPYPRGACPMQIPRQTGESSHGQDEWFERRDGTLIPVDWWSAPIQLTTGRGAVLAFNDCTERRAAQQAARERDAAAIRAAESRAAQRRILEASAAVRQQVAADLRDGAQQQLISVLISLQLARDELGPDAERAHRLLDEAAEHAHQAIGELRELATGLHPAILAYGGLVPAVEELAGRAALPVAVVGSLPGRLPEAVENNAYSFVKEALANTTRHARATHATVTIGVGDTGLSVEVSDDGVGGARTTGTGHGLEGLNDRLGAFGGWMVLSSPPGQGTTVRAEIPVTHDRAEHSPGSA